ncbi:cullin-1-like [Prunus yedoensis var. nudiflora]|uniref:Cullin-1-like n=1 Tax=Prunus yedoensis var. nudiflora TaxID=2094558 RepID=A0A314XGH1_PRUYE|nr:cullin-1-like [Prunus yedoensis var. nudiflora]
MDVYEKDFEGCMLTDTRDYYSSKLSRWILEDSYIMKAEECLRRDWDIVSHYLHPSSEKRLVETVKYWLGVVHGTQLIEKKHSESGSSARLTIDNVQEELALNQAALSRSLVLIYHLLGNYNF